jgi:hypothetical protein
MITLQIDPFGPIFRACSGDEARLSWTGRNNPWLCV